MFSKKKPDVTSRQEAVIHALVAELQAINVKLSDVQDKLNTVHAAYKSMNLPR